MLDLLPERLRLAVGLDVIETVILVTVLLTIRFVVSSALSRNVETLSEDRRRWISVVNNTSAVLIGMGVLFIWSPQLTTFALSLTAFAVAMVIATKEFLLCLLGAAYRTATSPFEVGDWVEIDGIRGEVMAEGLLSTIIQELGEDSRSYTYTGRTISLPNALLLTHVAQNESFRKKFVHHTFSITIELGPNPLKIKALIESILEETCVDFAIVAERYWEMVRRKTKVDLPPLEPSVAIETTDQAKLRFSVTVFCPTQEAHNIETTVIDATMNYLFPPKSNEPTGVAQIEQPA